MAPKLCLLATGLAARAFAVVSAPPEPVYPTWHYFAGQNAVSHCPETCTDRGPLHCLGSFPSAADCAVACQQDSACSIMTWIDDTKDCWTRTDGLWNLTSGATTAGCNNATVPGCAPPPPVNGTALLANVSAAPVLRTHPLSPAVTLDFWNVSSPNIGPKWGNSSVLALDLSNPLLRALASQLAPGLLRLGGSPEDSVVFDTDGTCVAGTGGQGPSPTYYCSQVKPYIYGCLTPARWEALLEFASATGLRIILGLNGCVGRLSNTTAMNTSNAAAVIAATAASPHAASLWGFELSNEVVGAGSSGTVTPATYADDVAAIKAIADSAFAVAGLPPPFFVGPDVASPGTISAALHAAPQGTLTAITYHHYPGCEPGQFFFLLEPVCLLILDNWAAMYSNISSSVTGVSAWAGETAEHGGGGVAGLTDTFYSTLYYAWQLGALPANGVELSARQALVGGDYELLNRSTFAPNPDYAFLWLFKSLIGGGADAYAVSVNSSVLTTGVRVFAFSAAPSTGASHAVLALSLNRVGADFAVELAGLPSGPRVEYHLTGQPGVRGAPLLCNGVPLVPDARGQMPPWSSLGVPRGSGPLELGSASIVIATVGSVALKNVTL